MCPTGQAPFARLGHSWTIWTILAVYTFCVVLAIYAIVAVRTDSPFAIFHLLLRLKEHSLLDGSFSVILSANSGRQAMGNTAIYSTPPYA